MLLKMRFTGQGIDKQTGNLVRWNKGDVIKGEFDGLLPDTYAIATEGNAMARPEPKPIATRRRKATR
jgi:hypothetical protein